MTELQGTERHFHYWRSVSAARLLADDTEWLKRGMAGAGLIHVSGITLAILSMDARTRLWNALADVRSSGSRISFDPNVRPKLWASKDETRVTLARFYELTDIALPSFDDEAALWSDASPEATCERFIAAGVREGVIKNGAGSVTAWSDESRITVKTPAVLDIRDTAGAGDAFNAGYLAVRLTGKNQSGAVAMGHKTSSEVIRHFGARIPAELLPKLD